jgi:hypothetical protein
MIEIIKLICLLLNIQIPWIFGWGCHTELLLLRGPFWLPFSLIRMSSLEIIADVDI